MVSHASGEGLGGFLRVKAVVLEDARQDTYNFEVADTHTYFVGQLNAWVHNACDPGDLLANGGQYLSDDKTKMVGVHGGLFEKLPDGTFENIRPATAEEIELAGVVVQPLDASVGTNSFAAKAPNRTLANADDLAEIRTRHGLSGRDTVAAARTDILGLQGQTFEGLSPALRREGGLQSLDDLYGANRPIKSPNPNPIASRHAEEDIFNGIAQKIDNSGLTAVQLKGHTVHIHISNAGGVCNVCYQGLGNSTATPGVIRQFSERYPGLNVRITSERGTVRPGVDSITVRGGQIVD